MNNTPELTEIEVGVVGLGLMGTSIIVSLLMAGHPVKAIAPIACTPPTLKIFVTPTNDAVYTIAGFNDPSLPGGEHKIISLHPASVAGIPSINIVENNGAVPPGI